MCVGGVSHRLGGFSQCVVLGTGQALGVGGSSALPDLRVLQSAVRQGGPRERISASLGVAGRRWGLWERLGPQHTGDAQPGAWGR